MLAAYRREAELAFHGEREDRLTRGLEDVRIVVELWRPPPGELTVRQ
jgi:hypothetical protein